MHACNAKFEWSTVCADIYEMRGGRFSILRYSLELTYECRARQSNIVQIFFYNIGSYKTWSTQRNNIHEVIYNSNSSFIYAAALYRVRKMAQKKSIEKQTYRPDQTHSRKFRGPSSR